MFDIIKFNNLKYQTSLFKKLILSFSVNDKKELLKSYNFAKKKHRGQLRYDGHKMPYIIHPIRSVIYLISILKVKDLTMLQAMMLHDVVEDTETTLSEVKQKFGLGVGELVAALTRPHRKNESELAKKTNKINHLLEIIKDKDKKVKLLKAVDKLDNLRSYYYILDENLKKKKMKRWRNEVEVYGLKLASQVNKQIFKDMKEVIKYYKLIKLF